ncbi:MAG TPA: SH3 domain-containing protein [Spirochaetota bacterium]|nr:SH3 domain-containing protein [Spirochaetota bacterium]HPI89196.1 SH3 domain-containing protein [Spirochaetota bacterium]HPR48987.1 SH3 domain-containing protein [Spirochaetota bacterium]
MRIIVSIIAAIIVATGVIAGYFFFRDATLDDAIDDFENGHYRNAIVTLNELIPKANYDSLEKIYYYRARSANRLAEELNDDFSDELAGVSLEKKGSEEYTESLVEIEEELSDINSRTGADLAVAFSRDRSRIISRGKFYDEFSAKFRGSSLIEDLDFEEMQKMVKAAPENGVEYILAFYRRYPNTTYLAHIIRHLFDSLNADTSVLKDSGPVLFNLIVTYGKRFPTSPEITRLYTVSGDNVNLRNSPGTEGSVVGKAGMDEIVIQLEKSMDTMQVGDVRDYWYRIASLSGAKGWIFGKFLKKLDISRYTPAEAAEAWTQEEYFTQWSDSNTPAGWTQVNQAAKTALSFYDSGSSKIVRLTNKKGQHTGLFSRFSTARAFTIETRARFCSGKTTLFAYVTPDGRSFALDIADESVEISGRTIPLHTGDWHVYKLISDNGSFAQLLVDGEIISARIEPKKTGHFTLRGVYCLYSDGSGDCCAEMDYIKIR